MFGKILDGLSLFRGESLLVTKVMENLAGVGWLERDVVQADHALNSFLPTFRSSANPRDAGHVAFGVGGMATTALAYDQWVFDREAVFARRLGRLGRCPR
jgi:hypothetical protein